MTDIPPPPPEIERLPSWASDRLARDEVNKWTDERELKNQKNKNELWALKAIGGATFSLIIFFAIIFVVSLGSWIAHYLLPTSCHWLTEIQLSKIQSVVFSGAIGAIVSAYAQRHLSK